MAGHPGLAEAPILDAVSIPRHLAVIMDGNGRWAKARGLSRTQGHRQGVVAVRNIVASATKIGIEYLTLFSFSSENWSRPATEIAELLGLLKLFIRKDLSTLKKQNVRVLVIGGRADLSADLVDLLEMAEERTAGNTGMTLVIAFNYGSRSEMTDMVRRLAREVEQGRLASDQISEEMISSSLYSAGIPDPDVIIRTSGEKRLSNFLLWQAAYAEFVFVDCNWPDFDEQQLILALEEYGRRNRRFGGLAEEDCQGSKKIVASGG
ncbi:Undecaprenyl pyrophosphate synthetase [Cohaesibacter sp. ES.047]|uniref:isoprenyl transferase n=1 Tax=Cohaesibacter sp. ES.047 TaxID=1798205 RepID=UPI000BB8A79A|nr:isoprenyl transferase [Cohaesibacter sp. ES.047]SNY93709.1 Undecaprenyl pyrophosphate synthetase [Cohaesibacter sp. ES.047]